MTIATNDSAFSPLFAHKLRKDWGVAVLAAEFEGKRRYLFEDGEERAFAPEFYKMLQRVDEPDDRQQAAHERLRGALARRNKDRSDVKARGESFFDQLVRFHQSYAAGFSDPSWSTTIRGERAPSRTPRHRQPAVDEAHEQLSLKVLDQLISAQHFPRVWDQLVDVLRRTDLVPAAQYKLKAPSGEPARGLALAVRELLHGAGPYNVRFDRFLAAFAVAFGQPAKWELATAPSALLHPREHVSVEPTTFRKQVKLSGASRPVALQPSSAAYTALLAHVQLTSNKLAEHGEIPRDLFDVREFIVFTLKSPPRTPATSGARGKAPARPASSEAVADLSVEAEE